MQQIDGSVDVAVDSPIDQLENLFTYHAPDPDQVVAYGEIRNAALGLARTIDRNCPRGPDRRVAMGMLRETVMIANASIATGGGHYE